MEAVVETVRVLEQVGVQDTEVKEAPAPAGSPEAENDTLWEVPETSVPAIVLVTNVPGVTVLFPPFVTEKSKDEGGGREDVVLGIIPQIGVLSKPLCTMVDQLDAFDKRVQAAEAPEAPWSTA